jgi:hypothetical protein
MVPNTIINVQFFTTFPEVTLIILQFSRDFPVTFTRFSANVTSYRFKALMAVLKIKNRKGSKNAHTSVDLIVDKTNKINSNLPFKTWLVSLVHAYNAKHLNDEDLTSIYKALKVPLAF